MDRDPEVVFVGHEATLTGAPILLLHLLGWLRAESHLPFTVLLMRGGRLEQAFRELGGRRLVGRWPSMAVEALDRRRTAPRVSRRLYLSAAARQLARFQNARVFYLNTAAAAELIPLLPPKARVITHVHELEHSLKTDIRPEAVAALGRSHRVIAAGSRVAENLIANHGVPESAITIVPEFVRALPDLPMENGDPWPAAGLPEGIRVVGSCGGLHWRKGPDLFVQVAKQVLDHAPPGPPLHFVWVGAEAGTDSHARMIHDVDRQGISDRFWLIPPVSDPFRLMSAMEVFLLTSREDPFPVVCLEAAALGRPVLAFDCGNIGDLLQPDGLIIPYGDVPTMATRVRELLSDRARARRLGGALRRRVMERYLLTTVGPAILEVIREQQTAARAM